MADVTMRLWHGDSEETLICCSWATWTCETTDGGESWRSLAPQSRSVPRRMPSTTSNGLSGPSGPCRYRADPVRPHSLAWEGLPQGRRDRELM